VVIENVGSFLQSSVWRSLAEGLRRLGYDVSPHLLDAVDFGAAQLRKRSFTLATRRSVMLPSPESRRRPSTVREVLAGLPLKPDGRNHHYAPTPSKIALARMKVIPPGGGKRDVMKRAPRLAAPSWWRLDPGDVADVWGRMHWDRPSNTLRTAFNNASKGRYIHPQEHRVISLREAARLQGIPDRWAFDGWPQDIARQIGNSVHPAVGRAVARAVLKAIG
jgi:DNA (cytosine-5)-methyltransferase 1